MNHGLRGYYALFGIMIGGLKGPAVPVFGKFKVVCLGCSA